jgi:hypothetical protein
MEGRLAHGNAAADVVVVIVDKVLVLRATALREQWRRPIPWWRVGRGQAWSYEIALRNMGWCVNASEGAPI